MAERKIVWDTQALISFEKAVTYIAESSIKNADKVMSDILALVNELKTRPERHSLDKYKQSNDGTIRAFEKHKFRVSYQVKKGVIKIARFRNTRMDPKDY